MLFEFSPALGIGRAGIKRVRPVSTPPGQHQFAISDFDAAIDRDPYVSPPYQARAQSYIAVGKYDTAVEDLNAALNINRNNSEAWALRGVALEKLGKKKEALESYQSALGVDEKNQMARDGLGRVSGGGSLFR